MNDRANWLKRAKSKIWDWTFAPFCDNLISYVRVFNCFSNLIILMIIASLFCNQWIMFKKYLRLLSINCASYRVRFLMQTIQKNVNNKNRHNNFNWKCSYMGSRPYVTDCDAIISLKLLWLGFWLDFPLKTIFL